jgi:hypothetical protein
MFHFLHIADALYIAQQHNGSKNTEPIWPKSFHGQRVYHGIGIALLNLSSKLV